MSNCVVCGKPLSGKRGGAKTCSANCRSKAYYHRKAAEKRYKDCHLDMFDQEDLKSIGRISFDCAIYVQKTANVQGREAARELLDVICDLLTNAGVNWQNG